MLPPISERIAAQLGARVATPGEVDAAINGPVPERFPNAPQTPEGLVFDESKLGSPTPDFNSLVRGGPSRRTKRLHAEQGGRSSQSQGNCHYRGGYGRR